MSCGIGIGKDGKAYYSTCTDEAEEFMCMALLPEACKGGAYDLCDAYHWLCDAMDDVYEQINTSYEIPLDLYELYKSKSGECEMDVNNEFPLFTAMEARGMKITPYRDLADGVNLAVDLVLSQRPDAKVRHIDVTSGYDW